MSELISPTTILGFRPDQAPVEPPHKEESQAEGQTDESGDTDLDQGGVSASDVLDNSEGGDFDEGEGEEYDDDQGGDKPTPEMAGIQAQIDDLKKDLGDKENARREWQSKANQAEADLGKALDLIQQLTSGNGAAQDNPQSALSRLDKMDDGEVVDAGTVRSLVAELRQGAAKQQESERYENLVREINSAVESKQDVGEVRTFFQEQNLGSRPDAKLMNRAGNYWMGKALLLEKQLKEAEAGKKPADPPKRVAKGANKNRQQRLNDIPPVTGSRGTRPVSQGDPTGIVEALMRKRKARGIMDDGRIR